MNVRRLSGWRNGSGLSMRPFIRHAGRPSCPTACYTQLPLAQDTSKHRGSDFRDPRPYQFTERKL